MNNDDNGSGGVTFGSIIIYIGIVLGNIEWILDILFALTTDFVSPALGQAAIVFLLAQPVWFWFMYTAYVGSHQEIDSGKERCSKLMWGSVYTLF